MRLFIKHKFVGFVIILCISALCLSAPAYLIFQNAKEQVAEDLGNNAIDIAKTVAVFVAKDIEDFKSISIDDYVSFDGQEGAPGAGAADTDGLGLIPDDAAEEAGDNALKPDYFFNLKQLLETLETQTGADHIYIERKLDSSEKVYFFGDDYSMNRDLSGDTLSEEEHRAFNDGTATQSGILIGDASDEFIAGYAPIIDRSSQKIVAIVAVEFSVDYADNIISGIRNIIFTCFIIIFLLTSAVVYKLVESRQKYIKKDYLTELCNKRYFIKDLALSVKSAKRSKRALSLMMLDVDYFKTINDKLGHVCGDDVLRTISEMLMKLTRSSDVCCRYGGDEFVITMPDTDSAQASMIAERIRNEVSKITYTLPDNEKMTVTLSIGVAELKDNMTPENLVENADDALYKSKNSGKNCTLIKL